MEFYQSKHPERRFQSSRLFFHKGPQTSRPRCWHTGQYLSGSQLPGTRLSGHADKARLFFPTSRHWLYLLKNLLPLRQTFLLNPGKQPQSRSKPGIFLSDFRKGRSLFQECNPKARILSCKASPRPSDRGPILKKEQDGFYYKLQNYSDKD